MNNKIIAGLVAIGLTTAVFTIPAQARCEDTDRCNSVHNKHTTLTYNRHRVASADAQHRTGSAGRSRQSGAVIAMIRSMAPQYGVPTWFALRIAKVESGYNPNARGAAGELGVFQMKCATARGIGYRGGCSGLLNARTGVQYGLKHLSIAIRSSNGNLRLAASKHNGGLGRKRLVPRYVAMVF